MKKNYQEKLNTIDWNGLPENRFRKYRPWINREKPGQCGTYVSAVLLDDYLRKEYNIKISKNNLLTGLKSVVDDLMPYRGTFYWDVIYGLNYMLEGISDVKAKYHLIPDKAVVEILEGENPRPVIVGTLGLLNSSYKNHWLVVYAYGYDEEGDLYFKGYDNHGRYRAVIPASQTFTCVWLENN